jgi:hypothetical protein
MHKILKCRRSTLALIAMAFLTLIALINNIDVSLAICGIVTSVAAANAAQSIKQPKGESE